MYFCLFVYMFGCVGMLRFVFRGCGRKWRKGGEGRGGEGQGRALIGFKVKGICGFVLFPFVVYFYFFVGLYSF